MISVRKQTFILILLVASFTKVVGQVGPPRMAMPSDSNSLLVNKIIEVTNHEKYFTDYCTNKVTAFAKENNWAPDKTTEILKSIQFKNYSATIYNSYAFYTTEQLTKLLNSLTELSKNAKNSQTFILTNQMMQSNLDIFVKSVIEGHYVESKQ
ncbi:MAG TPA: hypothetical protein VN726_07740 [Hanamia sp.]|nr:hypothetical protein [Hanamia sp.]